MITCSQCGDSDATVYMTVGNDRGRKFHLCAPCWRQGERPKVAAKPDKTKKDPAKKNQTDLL